MRLIDAYETYKVLTDYYHIQTPLQQLALKEALVRVPTVDAEPVRHGKWILTNKPNIYGGTTIQCSECGYEGVIAHIEDHHYCWVCGAKMEGVEE